MPRAMASVWSMLRSRAYDPTTKVRMLLDAGRILGFDLKGYVQSEEPRKKYDPQTYLAAVPAPISAQVRERDLLRAERNYVAADSIRQELHSAGYALRDTAQGSLVLRRRPEDEFTVTSSSTALLAQVLPPPPFELS